MRLLRALVAAAFLVLAGAAAALPAGGGEQSASGPLVHANSRDGQAIVSAEGLAPGDERSGRVTITNGGSASPLRLVARPSAGPLSERLTIAVTEVSGETIASGPLAALPSCTSLGTYAAREERTYAFTVALPRGGRADDRLAGASARVDFEWLQEADADCRVLPPAAAPAQQGGAGGLRLGDLRLAVEPGPYRFSPRTGAARVGIRCLAADTGLCRGRLELERWKPGQGRGIAMAAGSFGVRRGARRTVTVKLNQRARRRITSTGQVPVRARVTVRESSGRRRTATYRDRLLYGTGRGK